MRINPETYRARLEAFAAQADSFQACNIRDTDGGLWSAGAPYKVPFGRIACQCCGNRRLKNIYPVQAEEDGRVYLIGSECWKQLDQLRKLHVSGNAPTWNASQL